MSAASLISQTCRRVTTMRFDRGITGALLAGLLPNQTFAKRSPLFQYGSVTHPDGILKKAMFIAASVSDPERAEIDSDTST
jgi:hypothetical protein